MAVIFFLTHAAVKRPFEILLFSLTSFKLSMAAGLKEETKVTQR